VTDQPATKRPRGRPCGPKHQHRIRLDRVAHEMVLEAARLCDVKPADWMRRVLYLEAVRQRLAASNIPQGLHPKVKVYRVTDAPAQGAWSWREHSEAIGIERVYVTQILEDAPKEIARDGRACVIDIILGQHKGKNLLVAFDGVRWIGSSPLTAHLWAEESKKEEERERSQA